MTPSNNSIDSGEFACQSVLEKVRATPNLSPRDLEIEPPPTLSARETRVAVQELLDTGQLVLNDRLKLEVRH
jgi:hypothetical protein